MGRVWRAAFMEDESKHLFENTMNMCNRDLSSGPSLHPLLGSGASGAHWWTGGTSPTGSSALGWGAFWWRCHPLAVSGEMTKGQEGRRNLSAEQQQSQWWWWWPSWQTTCARKICQRQQGWAGWGAVGAEWEGWQWIDLPLGWGLGLHPCERGN